MCDLTCVPGTLTHSDEDKGKFTPTLYLLKIMKIIDFITICLSCPYCHPQYLFLMFGCCILHKKMWAVWVSFAELENQSHLDKVRVSGPCKMITLCIYFVCISKEYQFT